MTLSMGWVIAFAAALAWLSHPVPDTPPPPGWRNWKEVGAVKALSVDGGGVFAGGPRGLFYLNSQGMVKPLEIPGVNKPFMVNALLMDADGVLWVGHDQGLSRRVETKWRTLTRVNGLPSEHVLALAKTQTGSIWVGTRKGAVQLESGYPWKMSSMSVWTSENGLLHEHVSAVLEDAEGGIWFGSYAAPAGGLSYLKDGKWLYWTTMEGLPHANITSLMLDREGRIWAGCGLLNRGGAVVFSKSSGEWRCEGIIPQNELAGPKVRSLLQDSRGHVWLGSEYDGLTIRRSNKTLRVLTVDDGLAGQEVMSIAEAEDGSIWLGTVKGLTLIRHEALASLLPE
jgi:ligand-binding sensor domain-containing protein